MELDGRFVMDRQFPRCPQLLDVFVDGGDPCASHREPHRCVSLAASQLQNASSSDVSDEPPVECGFNAEAEVDMVYRAVRGGPCVVHLHGADSCRRACDMCGRLLC